MYSRQSNLPTCLRTGLRRKSRDPKSTLPRLPLIHDVMVWSNCLYPPPRIIVSTTPSWAEWLASSFTEKARYLPVFVHQFIGNLAWHTAKSTSNSFGSETAYHVHYESRIVGLDYAVLNVSSPLAGFRVKPEMILRVIRNFFSYGTYFYSILFTVITCSSFYLSETLALGNHACYFGSRLVFAFSCSFDEYCPIHWISIDSVLSD